MIDYEANEHLLLQLLHVTDVAVHYSPRADGLTVASVTVTVEAQRPVAKDQALQQLVAIKRWALGRFDVPSPSNVSVTGLGA